MTTATVKNKEHWHQLRARHVGASESAALFGESPWLTEWQLWHIKAGNLDGADEKDIMTAGKHFEPAIAAYAQEKWDINLRKVHRYISADDCPGMGASLDYEESGGGTLIPTELKFSLWGDGWEFEGDEIVDAPLYYMLQVQHQLGCVPSAPYGQLIAFTGRGLSKMKIERRDGVIAAIKEKVAAFWKSIEEGQEPHIDFVRDTAAVTAVSLGMNMVPVDFTGNPKAEALCRTYIEQSRFESAAKDAKNAARTEMLTLMMDEAKKQKADAENDKVVATVGSYKVSAPRIKETPPTIITEDMVGQETGGRKGYRRVTISQPKAKK